MKVSVIIPVREVGDLAREAVDHLRRDFDGIEILVVPDHGDGASLPGATIVPSWPLTTPGDKRDMAAKVAEGEILAFLDDDAYPHPGWLRAALPHFSDPTVGAVGGPGVTPPSNDKRQKASGWVLASAMGSGRYTYRFLSGARCDVDDFPSMNLLVRKSDFQATGGFDSRYWPGEDSDFCQKFVAAGRRIVYEPEAVVYHHRRPVFGAHLRQQSRYGLHRGHFARRFAGNSRRVQYAVPSMFVIGLLVGPPMAYFSSSARRLLFSVLAVYGGAAGVTGAWVYSKEQDLQIAALATAAIPATHIGYGLAYIRGFLTPELDH